MFSYAVIKGKSVFIGKIGPTIHYVSASTNSTTSTNATTHKIATCTFTNQLSWGYSTGLEYNYQLSKQLALVAELGFEQYKYSPNRATVKGEKGTDPAGKEYEILYVNEIVNESVFYQNYPQWKSIPSQTKRLKEFILFNSIYFGIGIKYNLWEK